MSFEFNKIMGAGLLAVLVGMLSGFVSEKVVEPRELEKPVYQIAVADEPSAPAPAAEASESAAPAPTAEAAPVGPEPIAGLLASADVSKGQALSKVCAACHSFDKGGPNKVGPNLWGIVGSKHAHAEGFAYSTAMKGKAGETWDYDAMNAWLFNPKAAVPGNKMAYAGMKKTEDRANLIAWLRTLSDSPKPLP